MGNERLFLIFWPRLLITHYPLSNLAVNMPKEFSRTRRVSELIRRELVDIIRREISDPNLGMLTISAINVSPDLKQARIYMTILGGNWSVEQTLEYLNKVAGPLRHHLSQRLATRTTPRLQFVYDSSIEYGSRLSALIDSLHVKKNEE